MKYIVYQTINLVNNKIYIGVHKTLNPDVFDGYIGCGVNIMNSGTYSHPTTAFQYAVKKYGKDKFKRSVLAVFDTAEAAYHMEESIVTKEFINRPDVYNMITGGIQAPTNAIKVYQFTLDGKFLKEWESAQEACDFYGVSHTAILNAINLKGSCRKYYWSRTKEIIVSEYSLNEGQVCYQYDQETGKLMNIYNSIYECSKVLGVTSSSIQRAVKGGYPFNGYYFSTSLYEEFKGNPKTQLHNSYLYVYDLKAEPKISFNLPLTYPKDTRAICKLYNSVTFKCIIDLRLKRLAKGDKVIISNEENKYVGNPESNIVLYKVSNDSESSQFNFVIPVEEDCGDFMLVGALKDIGYTYLQVIIIIVCSLVGIALIVFGIAFCIVYEITHRDRKGDFYRHKDEKELPNVSTTQPNVPQPNA